MSEETKPQADSRQPLCLFPCSLVLAPGAREVCMESSGLGSAFTGRVKRGGKDVNQNRGHPREAKARPGGGYPEAQNEVLSRVLRLRPGRGVLLPDGRAAPTCAQPRCPPPPEPRSPAWHGGLACSGPRSEAAVSSLVTQGSGPGLLRNSRGVGERLMQSHCSQARASRQPQS